MEINKLALSMISSTLSIKILTTISKIPESVIVTLNLVLFGSWAISTGTQLYIILQAFKQAFKQDKFDQAILCLFVPFYVGFFASKKSNQQTKAFYVWGVSTLTFFTVIVIYIIMAALRL
ncbi:hypothetical protein [Pseudanabaena sp. 'Roaring Creek']|uniref:hypothetical protein n=1 Tax=Pseudanabaena sp. 'Roaring Creek' TaxID=1681830 RepID=UPI0006D7BCA0|nr:hypothetical protein [Pseudanabaena sp. 'Roaring Creek']